MYTKLDVIIAEIQSMIQVGIFFVDDLKLKLDMFSLQKKSPSVISPRQLRALLDDIRSQLSANVGLIGDPLRDIWSFYANLRCTALFSESYIYVVITVPLLNVNDKFDVFRVYNLPLPMNKNTSERTDNTRTNYVASYDLEADGFLIDPSRTKYALLSRNELTRCSNQDIPWCGTNNAVLPIALSKSCLINLFLGNKGYISQFCKTLITLDTTLPLAEYLFNNHWAIVSTYDMTLNVLCNFPGANQTKKRD